MPLWISYGKLGPERNHDNSAETAGLSVSMNNEGKGKRRLTDGVLSHLIDLNDGSTGNVV